MVQYNIVTTIILVFKREGYQALSQLANWVFLRMGVLILRRICMAVVEWQGRSITRERGKSTQASGAHGRFLISGEKVFGTC